MMFIHTTKRATPEGSSAAQRRESEEREDNEEFSLEGSRLIPTSGAQKSQRKLNGIEVDDAKKGDQTLLVYSKGNNKWEYKDYAAGAALVAAVAGARGSKASLSERVAVFDSALTSGGAKKDAASAEVVAARGSLGTLKDRLVGVDTGSSALQSELSASRNASGATNNASLKVRLDALAIPFADVAAQATTFSAEIAAARVAQTTGTHTALKSRLDAIDVLLVGTYCGTDFIANAATGTVVQDITTNTTNLWNTAPGTTTPVLTGALASVLAELDDARVGDGLASGGKYPTLERALLSLISPSAFTQNKASVALSGANLSISGTPFLISSASPSITNNVVLSTAAPTLSTHLTRKDYVDAKVLAGGTFTGALVMGSNALVAGTGGITAGGIITAAAGLVVSGGNSTLSGVAIVVDAPVTAATTNSVGLASGALTVGGTSTLTGATSFVGATGFASSSAPPVCSAVVSGANDIINKTYTDATFIPLAGGSFTSSVVFASGANLTVGGSSTLTGATSFVGATTFAQAPTCAAVPSLANEIVNKAYIDGFAATKSSATNTFSGAVTLSGGTSNLVVGGNLSVAGTTTLTGALTANGGVTVASGTFSNAGALSLTGATGNLSVAGTSALAGIATFTALPACASDPAGTNDLSRKSYVDAKCLAGGTFTANIVMNALNVTATSGAISTSGTGNIETTGSGSIRTTGTGAITSASTITAATGATVTSGLMTVTAGGVVVTAGNIVAAASVVTTQSVTVSGTTTLQGALTMATSQNIALSGTGTITAAQPISMVHGTTYSALATGHVVTKAEADTQIAVPQLDLLVMDVFS